MVETQPVDDYGDAADDIAIWVHPRDPARSLIIGAQKKRGIEVYDLAGRRLQLLPDGRMNNVDLRQGVALGGGKLDIVAASDRTNQRLALYAVDGATGRLRDIAASPIPTGMRDPYGLCMYVSSRDGAAYVFVNNSDRGEFKQWRLADEGGRVAATVVREFVVGSQAEGCVADDATGALYIAEEDVGLWRYSAEPDGGDERRQIDSTEGGRLTADAEGLAIFHGTGDTGYLVLSNQGADNYALYRREGDNVFIGMFQVGANDALGIDGASETDGLEVTSSPLGPAFPHGLLVVQDGRNITPLERQNFKLVPWQHVVEALGLR
jgi:3-phytase